MRFVLFIIGGVLVFLFSGIFDQKAYAYLDPGTGTYIFQLVTAALIGGICSVKVFLPKVGRFFKNLFLKKDQ